MAKKASNGVAELDSTTVKKGRPRKTATVTKKRVSKKIIDTEPIDLKLLKKIQPPEDNSNSMRYISGMPSPRMLKAIRELGYTNYTAQHDLIDNAVDAILAQNGNNENAFIKIYTHFDKDENKSNIIFVDNGIGMTEATLEKALQIGADCDKSRDFNLGIYGVGLQSASVSMGRAIKIITKHADDVHLCSVYDIDNAEKLDTWDFVLTNAATDKEIKYFNNITNNSETGTVVIVYKLDRIKNKNKTMFDSTSIKKIGEIYRRFIGENNDGEISFYFNDRPIHAIDPMGRHPELKETQLLNPNKIDQNYTFIYNGKSVSAQILYYYVDYSIKRVFGQEVSINGKNNGFYIMRNDRQIVRGEKLDFFEKGIAGYHAKHNSFRIEMTIDGQDDDVFQLDIKKSRITLPQPLITLMHHDVRKYAQTSEILRRKQMPQGNKSNSDIVKETKAIVDEMNDNRSTPTKLRDKHGNPIKKQLLDLPSEEPKEPTNRKPRKEELFPRKPKRHNKIRIEYVNLGDTGQFFVPTYLGDSKYCVFINLDHKFYGEFEKINTQGRELLIKTLHSCGLALHSELYDEDLEGINDFILEWSRSLEQNLRGQ